MSGQYDQSLNEEVKTLVRASGTSAQRISAATDKGNGLLNACKNCEENIDQIGSSPENLRTPGM